MSVQGYIVVKEQFYKSTEISDIMLETFEEAKRCCRLMAYFERMACGNSKANITETSDGYAVDCRGSPSFKVVSILRPNTS